MVAWGGRAGCTWNGSFRVPAVDIVDWTRIETVDAEYCQTRGNQSTSRVLPLRSRVEGFFLELEILYVIIESIQLNRSCNKKQDFAVKPVRQSKSCCSGHHLLSVHYQNIHLERTEFIYKDLHLGIPDLIQTRLQRVEAAL
jgi:hypothetical protein